MCEKFDITNIYRKSERVYYAAYRRTQGSVGVTLVEAAVDHAGQIAQASCFSIINEKVCPEHSACEWEPPTLIMKQIDLGSTRLYLWMARAEVLGRCVEVGQDSNLKLACAVNVHVNVLVEFAFGRKRACEGCCHVCFEMREPTTIHHGDRLAI